MKSVDLTKDMRPWRANDTIHVPDNLARTLVDNGEAKNMRPFNPHGAGAHSSEERPKGAYETKDMKGKRK